MYILSLHLNNELLEQKNFETKITIVFIWIELNKLTCDEDNYFLDSHSLF